MFRQKSTVSCRSDRWLSLSLTLNTFTTCCCSLMLTVCRWFDPAGLLLGWNINLDSRGNRTAWYEESIWPDDYQIIQSASDSVKLLKITFRCIVAAYENADLWLIVKVWFMIKWWSFNQRSPMDSEKTADYNLVNCHILWFLRWFLEVNLTWTQNENVNHIGSKNMFHIFVCSDLADKCIRVANFMHFPSQTIVDWSLIINKVWKII